MKKELIKEKYIELVIQNKSVKITVQDLCRYCSISRTTFYKHFRDCNSIAEYILVTDAVSYTYELLHNKNIDRKLIITNWYLSFFKHQDFYTIAIKDKSQNSLFDTLIEILSEQNKKIMTLYSKNNSHTLSDVDVDYYTYKYASMQAMLLKKWMADGMTVPPEKMAEYFIDNSQLYKII